MPITDLRIRTEDGREATCESVSQALNVTSAYIGEWAKGKGFRDTEEFIVQLEALEKESQGKPGRQQFARDLIDHLRMLEAGNKHMLIVTEICEAHENLRTFGHEQDDNYGEELADAIVRILDRAQAAGVKNIGRMFIDKLKVNARRPHKHGRKF